MTTLDDDPGPGAFTVTATCPSCAHSALVVLAYRQQGGRPKRQSYHCTACGRKWVQQIQALIPRG